MFRFGKIEDDCIGAIVAKATDERLELKYEELKRECDKLQSKLDKIEVKKSNKKYKRLKKKTKKLAERLPVGAEVSYLGRKFFVLGVCLDYLYVSHAFLFSSRLNRTRGIRVNLRLCPKTPFDKETVDVEVKKDFNLIKRACD